MTSIPLIVMAGRTNVGKSTLFNRLTESGRAITSPLPGTTRDLRQELVAWRDRLFYLCDLAGLEQRPQTGMGQSIQRKAQQQLATADLVLFVVDGQAGLLVEDRAVLASLRKLRHRPPLLLVINKLDHPRLRRQVSDDFLRTGLGPQLKVSAINGSGTGDLLDAVVERLPPAGKSELPPDALRVALIGRPNVGKSSLVNALAAEERVLVHSEPHTTRDAIDVPIRYQGSWFWIIDTAGIRRPSRVGSTGSAPKQDREPLSAIEKASLHQSLAAASRADVIALLLDLTAPLSHQDLRLISMVLEQKKPTIVVLNKWDLVKPGHTEGSNSAERLRHEILAHLERQVGPLSTLPVLMISAKDRIHVTDLLKTSQTIYNNLSSLDDDRIQTAFAHFTRWMGSKHPPLAEAVLGLSKTSSHPLSFRVKLKRGTLLPDPLLRALEQTLRQHLPLKGIPIVLITKKIT